MKTKRRKDPAAVAMGRKGGRNSRKYLTEREASDLGRKAAEARWGKKRGK